MGAGCAWWEMAPARHRSAPASCSRGELGGQRRAVEVEQARRRWPAKGVAGGRDQIRRGRTGVRGCAPGVSRVKRGASTVAVGRGRVLQGAQRGARGTRASRGRARVDERGDRG